MNRTSITWCIAAALLTFGPVGWRMLSWERTKARTVDEASANAGAELFHHNWQSGDPLSSSGDGLGPVFNARSCVACHNQNGPGGSGGREHNVTLFRRTDGPEELRDGVIHADATDPRYLETLALLNPQLPAISKVGLNQIVAVDGGVSGLSMPGNIRLAQRNTPALFGVKMIDEIPDRVIIAQERAESIRNGMASSDSETLPVGRALRLADGHVGRFGWKGQTARLGEFVQAACANELGLGNPGHDQPQSLAALGYRPRGMDLTQEQCDQLTDFVSSLERPIERLPDDREERSQARAGKTLFSRVGCADCHTPNLGLRRWPVQRFVAAPHGADAGRRRDVIGLLRRQHTAAAVAGRTDRGHRSIAAFAR